MTNTKNLEKKESSEIIDGTRTAVSIVFRSVPQDKRKALEELAKKFTKKHRKLVNYIEK